MPVKKGCVPHGVQRPAEVSLPNLNRRLRQGRRSALGRACAAAPGLRIHDALAGWGSDGLVLATLGCRVHMSERNPEVYAVLVKRLAAWPGTKPTCQLEDARSRWCQHGVFDVVYLDPMFGTHPKSAQPAQHMQVLATLADAPNPEALTTLIEQARGVAMARVVVKRRASAAVVGKPDWCIRARSVRFDVYRPISPSLCRRSSA